MKIRTKIQGPVLTLKHAFGRSDGLPCFHYILELVLNAHIQKRWPTEGPRDSVKTCFKKKWPDLLEKMDDILSSAN